MYDGYVLFIIIIFLIDLMNLFLDQMLLIFYGYPNFI
jgi:hypothetical protein